ncbi:MAG TPA: ABC transporter ATP-binding protein [Desulfobacteria bacterium]|nr:ABC transporter ATP-binding protein [Desulfobacteria bacterium]
MELLTVRIAHAGYLTNKQAIKNIDFSISAGQLVGLIGPNGAGKSTTLKGILGLLPEIKGQVQFSGQRKSYAYIPEQPVFYDGLTLWEHLEFAAAAGQIPRQVFTSKAEELLRKFRLVEVRHHFPATFSKGMQQKVMLILGFLLEPDVYIVDEPFIGLDPRATKEFLALIYEARNQGAGVLMSTHVLDTAEKVCDSFVLMADGTIVSKGNLAEIRNQCNLPDGSLFDCFDRLLEGFDD